MYKHTFVITLYFLIGLSLSTHDCPVYKCMEGNDLGDKCRIITYGDIITEVDVNPCKNGEVCNYNGYWIYPIISFQETPVNPMINVKVENVRIKNAKDLKKEKNVIIIPYVPQAYIVEEEDADHK